MGASRTVWESAPPDGVADRGGDDGAREAHKWTKPPAGTVMDGKALSFQARVQDTVEEWHEHKAR